MKIGILAAALAVAVGMFVQIEATDRLQGATLTIGASEAFAGPRARGVARRTTRRVARRTTRRHVARRTTIAGCAVRAPYWYCDGAYYRKDVRDGVTAYVVVNP